MALRIDHLNKKISAQVGAIELVRDEEGCFTFEIDGETCDFEINAEKLSDLPQAEWLAMAVQALADAEPEDEESDEDEDDESTMSGTLNKYRPTYVKTVNFSGSASVDNGDEVAELLRGLNPDETCAIADHLFGEIPGTHFAKYQYLNRGQRRMNAGNRIRALIKRGEKTAADLQAAIRGDDLVDDETVV